MSNMIQISPRIGDTLVNIKGEHDDADIAWSGFGSLLSSIGGPDLARAVRDRIGAELITFASGEPATRVVTAAIPAQVVSVQPAAPAETWGNPPVPPMQPDPLVNHVAPQVPSAALPSCQHGVKKVVRAKPGSGKNWVALGCPARQGDPTACNPGLDFDAARNLGL